MRKTLHTFDSFDSDFSVTGATGAAIDTITDVSRGPEVVRAERLNCPESIFTAD